jgi:osmotically-inducible protein OsmY
VDDALKNNYVKKNYDSVNATVSNGVVILTGYVDSDQDRNEIRDRVQKIKGISNINDERLQVSGGKTSYNNSTRTSNYR